MNNSDILKYDIVCDSNGMVDYCQQDGIKYYPFKKGINVSGLLSSSNLKKGIIMKTIELRRMSY